LLLLLFNEVVSSLEYPNGDEWWGLERKVAKLSSGEWKKYTNIFSQNSCVGRDLNQWLPKYK
jgi:hypothetical protein